MYFYDYIYAIKEMPKKTRVNYTTELQQLITTFNCGHNKYKHNYVVFI